MCFGLARPSRGRLVSDVMLKSQCLGCQRCEAGPVVTLHDGRVVCNTCPDFKDECLAQHVLGLDTKDDRREFLIKWGKKHGDESRNRLGDLVRSVWEARRRA
jgi:uncharacterized protein with von Willebrand factor type A (vWA) domain